jgi:hypothetical protein
MNKLFGWPDEAPWRVDGSFRLKYLTSLLVPILVTPAIHQIVMQKKQIK